MGEPSRRQLLDIIEALRNQIVNLTARVNTLERQSFTLVSITDSGKVRCYRGDGSTVDLEPPKQDAA